MSWEFEYKKYFNIPEGRDYAHFEHNSSKFHPRFHQYVIDPIEKISDKKIRLHFIFFGGKGKNSTFNGKPAHFYMEAKFIGSILCDDVIFFEQEPTTNKEIVFTIDKKFWNKQRIINIQNPIAGKATIKCNKLYAEKMDCYFKYNDGWRKEEE